MLLQLLTVSWTLEGTGLVDDEGEYIDNNQEESDNKD